MFVARYAFTAMDMNDDGTLLTFTNAIMGPEQNQWMTAHDKVVVRII